MKFEDIKIEVSTEQLAMFNRLLHSWKSSFNAATSDEKQMLN